MARVLSLLALLSLPAASAVRMEGGLAALGLEEENQTADLEVQGPPLDKTYFVFLEVYMLAGTDAAGMWSAAVGALKGENVAGLVQVGENATEELAAGAFWHSEVTICPRSELVEADQKYLVELMKSQWIQNYAEVPVAWWQKRTGVSCHTVSFGGRDSDEDCSGVSYDDKLLSDRKAAIANADVEKAYKYFYGTADKSAQEVYEHFCVSSCAKLWSGKQYHPITRNCNYFASNVLKCAEGLSQSTPWLTVSKLRHIFSCDKCES